MRKKYLLKKAVVLSLVGSMVLGLCACGEKASDERYYESTTSGYNYDTESGYYESVACDSAAPTNNGIAADYWCSEEPEVEHNTNEYDDLAENSWLSVKASPLSTFAADVDTASYTNIRSNIVNGIEVPASSVRIEEMINYFHYDYEDPEDGEKFAVYTEYADCPWNEDTKLALVSLNTEDIDFSEAPDSNIVFLIDTSGSMFDENKLPLVQKSLCMLAENLTAKDRVSIVTYAGSDTVVLEGAKGNDYHTI